MESKLFIVLGVTFFFSFGVQALFYFWYLARREQIIVKYKTVFSYYSGIIGDAILIPTTNVFAVYSLKQLGYPVFDYIVWIAAFIIGFITTLFFHLGQKYFNLTNWTMPQKGKWTLLGIYHSLFMFCESIFLAFSLVSYLKHLALEGKNGLAGDPIKFGLVLMFFFFLTFAYDYRKTLFSKFGRGKEILFKSKE